MGHLCVLSPKYCNFLCVILWTDGTLWVMASADVLPRLQQRALEADQIISQLKAQLQQLKHSSAASRKLFYVYNAIECHILALTINDCIMLGLIVSNTLWHHKTSVLNTNNLPEEFIKI